MLLSVWPRLTQALTSLMNLEARSQFEFSINKSCGGGDSMPSKNIPKLTDL